MNIGADDSCRKEFDDLKFRKKNTRYIVYKIEKEKIVSLWLILGGWQSRGQKLNLGPIC